MSDTDTRRRKQLIVGGVSTLLLILVVACVANVIYNSTEDEAPKSNSPNLHTSGKSVEMICTSTDYQKTCKDTLSKVVKSDNPDPKEIVHAAVSIILEKVGAAFNKTNLIKTSDERVKGAIEDCKELFLNTKDELKNSLEVIVAKGIEHLPNREHDIRTWLSAVLSYQQTCVDGFPEGEVKTKLENGMKQAREVTSNALAIVKEAVKYISMIDVEGFSAKRRLLEDEKEEEVVGEDDAPSWVEEGERRVLREGMAIKLRPNVTVANDGTGDFRTINAALEGMPKEYMGRYVIYIKPGEYHENVLVTKNMPNVTMYGDSPTNTIITGNLNFIDGTRTFQTATFAAVGEGFVGLRLTFRNTAGAIKHQAVALRVQSDRSIFLACNIEAYQDTLYVQTHRQFYRGCIISGTVDFIFGDAAAVIQNSVIIVRKPLDNQQNIVTAQGRIDRHESTGIVLHKCRIIPDESLKPVVQNFSSYLGRPWKEYSKLVIMESEIGELIHPEGYMPWEGDFGLKTLSFTEYKNKGEGAGVKSRVKWPGVRVLKKEEAKAFTVANFIQGWDWIKKAGVPVPARMALYDN